MRTAESTTVTRLTATFALALSLACSSIQAVPLEYISEVKPATVDVYTGYGQHVAVDNPQLVGDSVVGTDGSRKQVAVPVGRIEQISARRFSSSRTVMLVGSLAVLAALSTYMVLNDDQGEEGEDQCTGPLQDVSEREACGFSMRTR